MDGKRGCIEIQKKEEREREKMLTPETQRWTGHRKINRRGLNNCIAFLLVFLFVSILWMGGEGAEKEKDCLCLGHISMMGLSKEKEKIGERG